VRSRLNPNLLLLTVDQVRSIEGDRVLTDIFGRKYYTAGIDVGNLDLSESLGVSAWGIDLSDGATNAAVLAQGVDLQGDNVVIAYGGQDVSIPVEQARDWVRQLVTDVGYQTADRIEVSLTVEPADTTKASALLSALSDVGKLEPVLTSAPVPKFDESDAYDNRRIESVRSQTPSAQKLSAVQRWTRTLDRALNRAATNSAVIDPRGDVNSSVTTTDLTEQEVAQVNGLRSNLSQRVTSLGLSPTDTAKVDQALDLLFSKQLSQKRKTGEVYVMHPMQVALNLIQDLGKRDAHLIIAAVLHDIVEDSDVTLEEIETSFGPDVARILQGVTNQDPDPTHFAGMTQGQKEVEKIRLYQQHVLQAAQDPEVFFIKILDLETNALALRNLSSRPDMQSRLANKYLRLVREFAGRARELGLESKAAQYEAAVGEVEGYARNWEYHTELTAETNAAVLPQGVQRDGQNIVVKYGGKDVSIPVAKARELVADMQSSVRYQTADRIEVSLTVEPEDAEMASALLSTLSDVGNLEPVSTSAPVPKFDESDAYDNRRVESIRSQSPNAEKLGQIQRWTETLNTVLSRAATNASVTRSPAGDVVLDKVDGQEDADIFTFTQRMLRAVEQAGGTPVRGTYRGVEFTVAPGADSQQIMQQYFSALANLRTPTQPAATNAAVLSGPAVPMPSAAEGVEIAEYANQMRDLSQRNQGASVLGNYRGVPIIMNPGDNVTSVVNQYLSWQRNQSTGLPFTATQEPSQNVGGIDLNPSLLDLQVKRDGNGVPLPLPQQPIQDMNIEGFFPVIINVAPVTPSMILGEMGADEEGVLKLSALK